MGLKRKLKNLDPRVLVQGSEENRNAYNSGNRDVIRWNKLDNSAHLFPAIANGGMSNVYRLWVVLQEKVDGETLQKALDIVLPKFPVFDSRLRQGLFWYYFEENGKKAPDVVEENDFPCRYINDNKNRSYLFRVTYYENRINLEVFHVLADGVGSYYFLKELTYQYLRMRHPELAVQYADELDAGTSLNTEDSYLANFKKPHIGKAYKKGRGYMLKGAMFPDGAMGVLHGYMPVDDVKKVAKKHGATINEYLVSVFIWAVYQSYLKGGTSRKPIAVSVPVNLRPYFGSNTAKNFFIMVTAHFEPVRENMQFEDVVAAVKSSLEQMLSKEHLEEVIAYNVTGESVLILRTIPLIFKNMGLKGFYWAAAKANTATVTNTGNITVPEGYVPYIKRFGTMLSRSKGQPLKAAIASFNGELTVTFTSVLKDIKLQRVFFRYLASQGIPITIESNGVYYE